MTEDNGTLKRPSSYGVEPKTIAALGGVGAVCGAVSAVLVGKSVANILGTAAVTGLACAIVGVVVSLHRKDSAEIIPSADREGRLKDAA
ncbi:hypothetical protein D9623_00450 [Azospirillum brasilense]|uniref:Uncharacterized protein n=1 Tax=Azospirillum brasilense TaxID=192 RepID=A0A0P0F190_AZOBR|nr:MULTISPECIES: hypothetical protein [Azospirillum]ALJ34244.1 hypothetical protein AMK58_01760 [Azospirillum brasilense]MDW7552767.1 hypothetical protein [Azospirillum brasilense]MDW7592041.1 hypothetical protein [Azospirillum brasilense]MDW7627682.1 hypothetical protein [Azospirillum brasilense]MDX5952849.1 hypothetical protein [Azospirillum brasilense]